MIETMNFFWEDGLHKLLKCNETGTAAVEKIANFYLGIPRMGPIFCN
jgi:hypothetical protein